MNDRNSRERWWTNQDRVDEYIKDRVGSISFRNLKPEELNGYRQQVFNIYEREYQYKIRTFEYKIEKLAESFRDVFIKTIEPFIELFKGNKNLMSPKKIIISVVGFIALIIVISCMGQLLEYMNPDEYLCVQSPFTGKLTWYTDDGGYKPQMFGKVEHYHRSFQYWFSSSKDEGGTGDQSIKTTFNDGGDGHISGSIRVDMPVDHTLLTSIHRRFGSERALEHELIRPTMERAITMSGPSMSSAESYAQRKPELLKIIEDQANMGIYQINTKEVRIKDTVTGQDKITKIVEFVKDPQSPSGIARQEESPVKKFGIGLYGLSINDINYDNKVKEQIGQQLDIAIKIQKAMADAKEAEQRAITAEQNGKANAMAAEWEQKTIKAREVVKAEQEKTVAETKAQKEKAVAETKAQQELQVATLRNQAADQIKAALIKEGEGEAAKKKAIMAADGALSQKLDAYKSVSEMYANAIREHKGPWVPNIVMGGANGGNGAMDMINLLSIKAAKDLGLDMSMNTK